MALIHCPECGKEVSSRASFCPKCGYPIKEINYENQDFIEKEIGSKQSNSNSYGTYDYGCSVSENIKKEKPKKKRGCLVSVIAFFLLLFAIGSCDDVYIIDPEEETSTEEEASTEEASTEVLEEKTETEADVYLTEEEYKDLCEELYYDDVFFGDEDLKGKKIKLNIFFSENKIFTVDDMYSSTLREYHSKYSLRRDFFSVCILRKDADSYFGRSISAWFSNHYDLNPSDYKVGQKAIAYADVISWSNNTWDGYNSVVIIPRYIDVIE